MKITASTLFSPITAFLPYFYKFCNIEITMWKKSMQFHRQSNIIPRQEDALHFRVASFKSFTAKPPIDRSGVQLWLFVCTFTSHRSALPRFAVARAINQEITRFSRIFRSCFPVFFRGRAWAFFGFGASPSAEGFRKRGWKAECRTRNLASRGRMRNTIRAIDRVRNENVPRSPRQPARRAALKIKTYACTRRIYCSSSAAAENGNEPRVSR